MQTCNVIWDQAQNIHNFVRKASLVVFDGVIVGLAFLFTVLFVVAEQFVKALDGRIRALVHQLGVRFTVTE